MPEWPREVTYLLRALSSEEPFAKSKKFGSFTEAFMSCSSSNIIRLGDSCDSDAAKKQRLNDVIEHDFSMPVSLTVNAGPGKISAASGTKPLLASHATSLDVLPQGKVTYHGNHADASSVKMARMAILEKLEYVLGGYLYNGMMASRLRKGQVNRDES